MKSRLPRPGQEMSAGLELIKTAPEDHFRLLEDVIGIVRVLHEAINIHPQRTIMVREQFEKFLGAVSFWHGR
jgi:hypothetical protein